MTATIDPGLARYRWYRPSDPDTIPRHVVDRVRARLHALDPKLDVWWNAEWKANDRVPGRWAIVYWMDRKSVWSIVYYWETATGDFRALDVDSVEPILNYLASIDADRHGKDVHSVNQKAEEIRAENLKKARKERIDAARERMEEGKHILGTKLII